MHFLLRERSRREPALQEPLPATTLSCENRKPEIRGSPAFFISERIVPLHMAGAIGGGTVFIRSFSLKNFVLY